MLLCWPTAKKKFVSYFMLSSLHYYHTTYATYKNTTSTNTIIRHHRRLQYGLVTTSRLLYHLKSKCIDLHNDERLRQQQRDTTTHAANTGNIRTHTHTHRRIISRYHNHQYTLQPSNNTKIGCAPPGKH